MLMKFHWIIGLVLYGILAHECAVAQQRPYFVDGYHGGIHGHYPLWVTGFMLDNLEDHPEWQIGLEIEPETWDTVSVQDAAGYARLRKWVASDRIDFTNPTYAQPYLYNILGESMIRQFTYGLEKHRDHFPDLTFTTYAVEEPCFTSSLPQILKQFGFKYAVLKCPNTCWGGYTRAYGGTALHWQGPDGSTIFTVPRYQSEELEENSTWQTTAWANSDAYLNSSYAHGIMCPVGMCYQDAGWENGPWLGTGKDIKNGSEYITWSNYFKQIDSSQFNDIWAVSQEDFLVNLMWGAPVLQRIAQQVRAAENRLLTAEKIGGMMYLDHGFQLDKDSLKSAWRPLMMAQHHDSWIVPYNILRGEQTWAEAIEQWTTVSETRADSMIQKAIQSQQKLMPKTDHQYVRIYNTLADRRSETVNIVLPESSEIRAVRDKNQRIIPTQLVHTDQGIELHFLADVAGFGYSTYQLVTDSNTTANQRSLSFDEQGNCIIENEDFRLVLDKARGGTFNSLLAKYADYKEYVDDTHSYRLGEVSGYFYQQEQFFSSKDRPVEFTCLRDDALATIVEISGFIDKHPFVQTLSLFHGQQRIDFDLQIDWKGEVGIGEYHQEHDWTDDRRAYTDDRYKLKVMFPIDLGHQQVYKNAPFDVTESQLDSTYFGKWSEIKHNVILNWVDVLDSQQQQGFTILTDHTTSYVHGSDYPLALTAQYSGKGLWGKNYRITGPLHMKYALIPHEGSWDKAQISARNNAWNEPLIASIMEDGELEDRQFVAFHDEGFEISGMEFGPEEIYLRVFNAAGAATPQQITLDFPVKSITEVLLNRETIHAIPFELDGQGSTFSMEMPRFGIKTLRIVL
ncbi:MAG: glycoside hydrolase family 38 C-terminal domain-containing protein [Sphingobacterium sp.]